MKNRGSWGCQERMKYQCHFHCCATQKNTGFVSMLDLDEASVFTGWINWQRWFHLSKHLSGRPRWCIAVSWIRRQGPFIWLPASGQRARWGLLQNLCCCLNSRPGVPCSLSSSTTSPELASVCSWGPQGREALWAATVPQGCLREGRLPLLQIPCLFPKQHKESVI